MADCCCCSPDQAAEKKPIQLRILDPNKRYGSHVALRSSLVETLAATPGCKCMQFYLGGNQSYNCRHLSETDREKTLTYCDRYDTTFYIHCPLVAFSNLSRPEIVEKSKNVVADELAQIRDLPGACVLHVGKVGTIEQVCTNLNEIGIETGGHPRMRRQLLMECAAGQGTELGRTWDEMRHLFEGLDYGRVGLCLDTQHLFASAMSDLQTHESIVKLFDAAESICPNKIQLFHLNDSQKTFGSRVDRHAIRLREGFIWAESDEGLKTLFERCFEDSIDMVVESKDPASDVRLIRDLYAA
jgi:deoxyribonuclease-4